MALAPVRSQNEESLKVVIGEGPYRALKRYGWFSLRVGDQNFCIYQSGRFRSDELDSGHVEESDFRPTRVQTVFTFLRDGNIEAALAAAPQKKTRVVPYGNVPVARSRFRSFPGHTARLGKSTYASYYVFGGVLIAGIVLEQFLVNALPQWIVALLARMMPIGLACIFIAIVMLVQMWLSTQSRSRGSTVR